MRVGAVVIGQTPRPDLATLFDRVSATVDLRGAMDLFPRRPPKPAMPPVFPLETRLRDGSRVIVDDPFLTPLIQRQLDALARDGAEILVILCAGPFEGLIGAVPLIHPFRLGTAALHATGIERILAMVPFEEQREPSTRKWSGVGIEADTAVFKVGPALADLVAKSTGRAQAVVFDYVGLPRGLLGDVRTRTALPALDLGHLAIDTLGAMLP